jgi:hypothetical protein
MMNARVGHDNVWLHYFMSLYLKYCFSDFLFVEAEHVKIRKTNRDWRFFPARSAGIAGKWTSDIFRFGNL